MKDSKLNRLLFWKKRAQQAETSLAVASHRLSNLQADFKKANEDGDKLAVALQHKQQKLDQARIDNTNLANSAKQAAELNFNLNATLAQSRENEKRLGDQLQARNAVLEGAKEALGNAKRELRKLQDLGIEAWACPNSPENPVCISTPGDSTEGHSLNLYVRGGVIVGVTVHERETGKLVTAAGLVAHDPNG